VSRTVSSNNVNPVKREKLLSGTGLEFNRQIDTRNTHKHDRSLSRLFEEILIQSGGVKLILWTINFHVSENYAAMLISKLHFDYIICSNWQPKKIKISWNLIFEIYETTKTVSFKMI
jgi:hypothetical protein